MCHLKTFLIIVVAIYPVTALAQNADDENEERVLEEIIVTATKREVNLQDLPLSVSVLTGQQLADVGATRMDYYWRMIPSLNVKDGPVGGDSVIIRGLSDTTSFFQNESLNAFFIDDTAVTLVPGLFNTPGDPALIDVARVEVLRGPQGTLVGANAMGGVIRVITQEPDIEMTSRSLDMNLSSTAHGGLNYGGNIILNQPLSNGNSAIRLVAFYQDEDGFINDIGLQNKDINGEQRKGARLSWLWNVSDSFEILARVYTEDIDVGGYNYADPIGKPEVGLSTEGDYEIALLSPEQRNEKLRTASLRLRWQTSWGEIYSATSWFEKDISLDIDWSPEFNFNFGFYFPAPFSTDLNQQDLSQELRFSSDGSGNLNWLAGLYYLDQDAKRFDTGSAPGIHEACPGCFPFIGPDGVLLVAHGQSRRKDTAVFGELNWRFQKDFEVSFGGRWYKIERELATQGFFTVISLDDFVSGDSDDFVPKLSLSWDVSDQSMVYALVSEGFRPGQFNNAAARDVCGARPIIDSDSLRNYEIGARTRLDNDRIRLNVTAFHIDWDDIQTSVFDFDCGFTIQENAGKATSKGLELEFTALLTDSLDLQGGIGYNEAKLDQANLALNAPKGQRIPNVPKVTANLTATWQFNWSGAITGFLSGDVQYVGSRTTLFDPSAQELFSTPAELDAYTLINLRLGAEKGRWRNELFVVNLFDEVADLFCCRLFVETAINRPRTIGVRTRYNF